MGQSIEINTEDKLELERRWNICKHIDFLNDFKKWTNEQTLGKVLGEKVTIRAMGRLEYEAEKYIRRAEIKAEILSKTAYIEKRKKEAKAGSCLLKEYYEEMYIKSFDYWKEIKKIYFVPCLEIMKNYMSEKAYDYLNQSCGENANNTKMVEFTRFFEDPFGNNLKSPEIDFFRAPGIIGRTIDTLSKKVLRKQMMHLRRL